MMASAEQAAQLLQEDIYTYTDVLTKRTFAEFFAGIGLVRMGLERAGWSFLYANDNDPNKKEMYEGHFGSEADKYDPSDIWKVDVSRVPTVTLATASFPCTDLSLAGAREGLDGGQSSTFWAFIRILQNLGLRKPPFVLLENVTGFLSSKDGSDFRVAMLALNNAGYRVDAFVLDAARFVPQSRKRLFIVGTQENRRLTLGHINMDNLTPDELRPQALIDFISANPDIDWNLLHLGPPLPNQFHFEDIIEDPPEDSADWWSQERAEYLLKQMSSRHRSIAEEMISSNRIQYATVFRRMRNGISTAELRNDGVAGCLRTPKGGSARQIILCAGKGKFSVRFLNPREAARLMGADDYNITVNTTKALFGFGDAVCVPAVEWVARNYINPALDNIARHIRRP